MKSQDYLHIPFKVSPDEEINLNFYRGGENLYRYYFSSDVLASAIDTINNVNFL